ncbi:MAG TPA: hypothetical protein VNL15_01385 [Dehalococcoidia bacterium]|nr:hypothetical protein [Dehalococcoidia bacterium]
MMERVLEREAEERPVLSPRLQEFLAEVLAGRAPNAGRFCGDCYSPLAASTETCYYCQTSTKDKPTITRVPAEVFAILRAQRSREGWVVRGIAYGGLLAGIILGLLPIAFADVQLWTGVALFAIIIFFYLLAANLANSLGDALGYRWGQAAARRKWEAHLRKRAQR